MRSLFAHKLQVTRVGAVALVVVCSLAAPLSAHSQPQAKTVARTGAAVLKGATSIRGVAWNADNTPIPGARVQLRNLVTGKIDGMAVANEAGQFTFNLKMQGGRYVVELLGRNGRVATVGHAFVIAPGESAATFVRLGTKVPWFSGYFGNVATALTSGGSSQGIVAIAPVQYCASPPCSPQN